MPAKKTKFATDEERAVAQARELEKESEAKKKNAAYPLQFLKSLNGASIFGPCLRQFDNRPFFADASKCRVCVVPEECIFPLVVAPDVVQKDLHMQSFQIKTAHFPDSTVSATGEPIINVLKSLSDLHILEIDQETNLPMMANDGKSRNKRPVISTTVASQAYTPSETFMRYFPAFLAGEKDSLFSDCEVTFDDANGGPGRKMTLTDALFSRILYDIDVAEGELPEKGSDLAKVFWEVNVRDKLMIVKTDSISPLRYAIYYTVCMPTIKHGIDSVSCQGQRLLKQADARIVSHWIKLTTSLVGAEFVPAEASNYVTTNMHKIDFDKILSEKAQSVCTSTWQSLDGAGVTEQGENGRRDVNRISPDAATSVVESWATKDFVNPSIDVTDADGNVKTNLVFNSEVAEKAFFGTLFTRAWHHDGNVYQAADYKTNLKKMSTVFKAAAYAILRKEPPSQLVPFDAEATAAAAAAKPARGRKRAVQSAVEMDNVSKLMAALEEKVTHITDTMDTFYVEFRNEAKRMKKLREFVFENIPELEKDESSAE